MKKIDLGQTINTLANLGVIVGIFFLVFQMRQSQIIGRSQVRNEITATYVELSLNDMNQDDRVLGLLQSNSPEPLSNSDRLRANIWANGWFRHWENIYYQRSQGMFDPDEFEAAIAGLRSRINNSPALLQRFCGGRDTSSYSQSFVEYVDKMLDMPCR